MITNNASIWLIMIIIALLASFSLCLAGYADDAAWMEYKLEWGKSYSPEEEPTRYANWVKDKEEVALENANYEATYETTVNEFSDMSDKEFGDLYLRGLRIPSDNETLRLQAAPAPADVQLPDEVNWVSKGYVTGVKNQGHCGSCYTFAATGSLEGAWFKKTGKLVSMSEQNLVDCSGYLGNQGCGGGWYQSCWDYIKAHGINTEEAYEYTSGTTGKVGTCHFDKGHSVAQVKGYKDLRRGDENVMQGALANVGPLAVAIDASRPGFRRYKRGVFYDRRCSRYRLNHAVLAVGYGTESGEDYWLVKNSWGTRWGAGGYVKMARNRINNCGIASRAAYPIV